MDVSTYAMKIASLAADAAVGGKLHGAKVMLASAPIVPDQMSAVGDLTAASFTGYAPVAVAAWTAPYVDSLGTVRLDGGDILFQPTDAVAPNTIYAWALTDTTGAILLYVETLDTPVVLADALHGLVITVSMPYGF